MGRGKVTLQVLQKSVAVFLVGKDLVRKQLQSNDYLLSCEHFSLFLSENFWWVLSSTQKSSSYDSSITKDCHIVNIDSGLYSIFFQHAPLISVQSRIYRDAANLAQCIFKVKIISRIFSLAIVNNMICSISPLILETHYDFSRNHR